MLNPLAIRNRKRIHDENIHPTIHDEAIPDNHEENLVLSTKLII